VTVASPTAVATIVIAEGATLAVTDDGDVTVADLHLMGGHLVNGGAVTATASLHLSGASELEGTPPQLSADDLGPTLVVADSPTGTVQVAGSVQLAGAVPPGLTLLVDHATEGAQAALILSDTEVHGSIVLRQEDSSGYSMLGTDQTVVNHGSIVVEGDGTGLFLLGGRLENHGQVVIDARLVGTGCSTVQNLEGGSIAVTEGSATTGFCLSPLTYQVDGGTLTVDGHLAATSVVLNAGTLTGTGTVASPVHNTGGTVAPGTPIGTLSIAGDYRQSGGGRLEVDIDGPSPHEHDLLSVSGVAPLGGTLVADTATLPLDPVVVLQASTVSGSFDDVAGVPATWVARSANAVTVQALATFPDVPLDHPFVWDVEWAAGRGIVLGHPDGRFRPRAPLSRHAWAVALYRSAGRPLGPDPACAIAPFADVPTAHPECGEIAWARDEGILVGDAHGRFGPSRSLSRRALATTLHRAAGAPDTPCTEPPFVDVPVTDPACGHLAWALAQGVVAGHLDDTFAPDRTVSRQIAVVALRRFAATGG
jgi:hypothetical protein